MRFVPILVLALVACPKPAPAPVAPAPPAPAVEAAPELAPFPYTAEAIGESWVTGLVVRWELRQGGGEPSWSRWEVLSHDDQGVTLEFVDTDADGVRLGPPATDTSSYVQLRNHASFPAAHTTVEQVVYAAPWGDEPAMLYTVSGLPDVAPGTIKRFWFGANTPGAPLRHTIETAGEPVLDMKMLSREAPE